MRVRATMRSESEARTMSGADPIRRIARGRRGVAMLIAIVVLAALFFMAVPFAVFMRQQHSTSTQAVQMARARAGEEGATDHATVLLQQGYGPTEQKRMAAWDTNGDGQVDAGEPVGDYRPFDDPDVDTLWEFRATLRTRLSAAESSGTDSDGDPVQVLDVDSGVGFPSDGNEKTLDGYVRVDQEWLGYTHAVIDTTSSGLPATLYVRDQHRGMFGTSEVTHGQGEIVSFFPNRELWNIDITDQQSLINVNTASYGLLRNIFELSGMAAADAQQAARNAIQGRYPDKQVAGHDDLEYRPYQNLRLFKTQAGLSADEFDLVRPYLTVVSGYRTGETEWADLGGSLEGSTGLFSDFAVDLPPEAARDVPGGSILRIRYTYNNEQYEEYKRVTAKNSTLAAGYPATFDVAGGELVVDCDSLEAARRFAGASGATPGYVRVEIAGVGEPLYSYTENELDLANPGLVRLSGATHIAGPPPGAGPLNVTVRGDIVAWHGDGDTPALNQPLQQTLDPADPNLTSPTIQNQTRHAINVNTLSETTVLEAMLTGLSGEYAGAGTVTIDAGLAETVAAAVLTETSGGNMDFFDGDVDWFEQWGGADGVEAFIDGQGYSDARKDLLKRNLNVSRSGGASSGATTALRFNSGSLVGLDSMNVIDNQANVPVAQSPRADGLRLARIHQIIPPLEPLWAMLRSQQEFVNASTTNLDTWALCTEFDSAFLTGVDDYTDRADDIGSAAPAATELVAGDYTTALLGLHSLTGPDYYLDLDYARGTPDEVNNTQADTDNTTAGGVYAQALSYNTDYAQAAADDRNLQADTFRATLQPFAVECWVRIPFAGIPAGTRQIILDVGDGEQARTATDQVRLYLEEDGGGRLRLRLRLDDETGNGYVLATSSDDWDADGDQDYLQPGNWYHVAVAVAGTFRSEMAMFIDGRWDENMDWEYVDAAGISYDEGSVNEGRFQPVAISVPNAQYTLAAGPNPDGTWPAASTGVTLVEDASDLPVRGMVAINGTAAGDIYEYERTGASTLNIVGRLDNPSATTLGQVRQGSFGGVTGESVATLVPVVRTIRHVTDTTPVWERVEFYGHDQLSVNPAGLHSFGRRGGGVGPLGPVTVSQTVRPSTDNLPKTDPLAGDDTADYTDEYVWLAIDPDEFPVGNTPLMFDIDEADPGADGNGVARWKVYNTESGGSSGLLAGALPCDPGDEFRVGGPSGTDGEVFAGEIDELRITSLGSALAGPGGFSDPLVEWSFDSSGVLNDRLRLRRKDAAWGTPATPNHPLAIETGVARLPWSAGFVQTVNGADEAKLYSYDLYDANSGSGSYGQMNLKSLVDAELVPSGAVNADPDELSRILPLGFITATQLDGDFSNADINVEHAAPFPEVGYVNVATNEIIGYAGRTLGPPGALERPRGTDTTFSAYPRGAYDTLISGPHLDGEIIWSVPVRHLDRYHSQDAWSAHERYDEVDMQNMAMVELSLEARDSQVRGLYWRFRHPLEADQRMTVLVNLDPANVDWSGNPLGLSENSSVVSSGGDRTLQVSLRKTDDTNPLLYGYILNSADTADDGSPVEEIDAGRIWLFNRNGQPPTAPGSEVAVRIYFDLDLMPVYVTDRTDNNGAPYHVPRIDTLGLETVPQPSTF